MSSFLWNVIPANGNSNLMNISDEEKSDIASSRFNWNYRMRTPSTVVDGYGHFSGWSHSKGLSGDPSVPTYIFGQDGSDRAAFEMYSNVFGGTFRPWYVRGLCQDGSSNALAAVDLDMFLTGTKILVASGITDQNGFYSLPSINFGVDHEIYANYANGTLVGASVDTLQPAL